MYTAFKHSSREWHATLQAPTPLTLQAFTHHDAHRHLTTTTSFHSSLGDARPQVGGGGPSAGHAPKPGDEQSTDATTTSATTPRQLRTTATTTTLLRHNCRHTTQRLQPHNYEPRTTPRLHFGTTAATPRNLTATRLHFPGTWSFFINILLLYKY